MFVGIGYNILRQNVLSILQPLSKITNYNLRSLTPSESERDLLCLPSHAVNLWNSPIQINDTNLQAMSHSLGVNRSLFGSL